MSDASKSAAELERMSAEVERRVGLGTVLEFSFLGDPPPTPAQIEQAARDRAREDREWAQFAESRMG